MKKVSALGETVKGIDISHHQAVVNWPIMKALDIKFVFLKASDGISYKDKCFDERWAQAKEQGFIRGAYHFFHPNMDPIKQAQHFVSAVGKIESGDLPLVMDWETTDGVPNEVDVWNGLRFLSEVERLTAVVPMIYTGPYFFNALKVGDVVHKYNLWIAHYGVSAPLVPEPWNTWTFWQTSDHFHISGMGGVDANVFNGTLEQLQSITIA